MAETKFIDGLRVFKPRDNAPDFVIANLLINKKDLVSWLMAQDGDVRADIKLSKGGNYYITINDYKPSDNATQGQTGANNEMLTPQQQITGELNPQTHIDTGDVTLDDLPF